MAEPLPVQKFRSLKEAEAWIRARFGQLELMQECWKAGCLTSANPRAHRVDGYGQTPTKAVEQLRTKLESRRRRRSTAK